MSLMAKNMFGRKNMFIKQINKTTINMFIKQINNDNDILDGLHFGNKYLPRHM